MVEWWNGGMWAAYIAYAYAVEGAGEILDWYLVERALSHVARLFCGRGEDRGRQEDHLIGRKAV